MQRIRLVLDCVAAASVIAVCALMMAGRLPGIGGATVTGAPASTIPADGAEVTKLDLTVPPNRLPQPLRSRAVLMEFSDIQCPYCARYAKDVFPRIKDTYIDSGKVTYLMLHFPLDDIHPMAMKAAEAVECAARDGKHLEMRHALYANAAGLSESSIVRLADGLGLTRSGFRSCLKGDMAAKVAEDRQFAAEAGVNSTPTFMLGWLKDDGQTVEVERIYRGTLSLPGLAGAVEELQSRRDKTARSN